MPFRLVAAVVAVLSLSPRPSPAQRPPAGDTPVCTPMRSDPASWLRRAARSVDLPEPGRVLQLRYWGHVLQNFQSDRSYPPFFASYQSFETWVDPSVGVERTVSTGGAYPSYAFPTGRPAILSGATAAWMVRDTLARPMPDLSQTAITRGLDPWLVLADYAASTGVEGAERCVFRDFPRVALDRRGPFGRERLLLDARSAVPVALLRDEPNPLWGPMAVQYIWSNWSLVEGGGLYPLTAFRVVEGETDAGRTVTSATMTPADSAPSLALPDPTLTLPAANRLFTGAEPPDTVRVSADTWLLRTRLYTSVVTLQRDTVFVLDATTSEARARQDADWVDRLFPRRHPVVLVVTDLAWPHIAGMRYWISRGAIVASHRASRAFLTRVFERRWRSEPDALERNRARTRLVFRPVTDSLVLADGRVVLHPIDGISSEGALLAWLPHDRFLWVSDYVQDLEHPSRYAREVLAAVRRIGVVPDRFAAEHLPLSEWTRVGALFPDLGALPSGSGSDSSDGLSSHPPFRE